MLFVAFVGILIAVVTASHNECKSGGVWSWQCDGSKCVKVLSGTGSVTELNTCKLTCGTYSVLFPKPTGTIKIGSTTVPFTSNKIKLARLSCSSAACPANIVWLVNNAFNRFQNVLTNVYLKLNKRRKVAATPACVKEAHAREINFYIFLSNTESKLTLATDESSSLSVSSNDSIILVEINAKTFFGARHALETISQLTAYKESHDSLQIVNEAKVSNDRPKYPYRGLVLDTSRNFFSVNSILRLITAMSFSKLNTLHWHITDTGSFPIEIKSEPKMSAYGAYSSDRIYTPDDIRKIVSHGLVHGVRIIPEIDQPAHAGEGWQWGPAAGLGNLAVCFRKEPWGWYCSEPPCGQLNPTNPNLYDVLGNIYKSCFEHFTPDMFHAGGDEVNINCWNTTAEITTWMKTKYGGVSEKDFMELWGMFFKKSTKKMIEANNNKAVPLIIWSSHLTKPEYINKYLDPKKHIIQVWTSTTDHQIPYIIKSGFKTIFSTYNTLYLDCGYGSWVGQGNNWCSPYKDWKLLYDNDPAKILTNLGVKVTDEMMKNVLGQEAAMWSEQVDEYASEGKIWPRTAALAERLWTNPKHDWREAEYRLIYHRERLVERGVQADALQPLWCMQNSGHC